MREVQPQSKDPYDRHDITGRDPSTPWTTRIRVSPTPLRMTMRFLCVLGVLCG
jgi:hypothetical protein